MERLSIIGSATNLEKRELREEYGHLDVKKGPWTDQEDALLINAVHLYGHRRWNSIAHYSGLKRTGKSCRLRWLNYVRPDVRRGNITLEEQLVILELHSRWGNRWSKIAEHLPGRTDNEVKNYWRTRVQKQAKQLNYDINSEEFNDAIRNVFVPQMINRIRASSFSCTNNNSLNQTIFDSPNGGMNLTTDTNRGAIEPSRAELSFLNHHECYNNNPLKYTDCGGYSEAQSVLLGHLSSDNMFEFNRESVVSGEETTLDSINDNLGLDMDNAWFDFNDFNGGETSRKKTYRDEEINAWLLRQLSDEDLPKDFACMH